MMNKPKLKIRPPKAKPVKISEPKFSYTSVCCNGAATKTACIFLGKDSKEAGTQGLGTWHCGACRKACKVTRSRNSLDKLG